MDIKSIGYVGLKAVDLAAWREYATAVLGVQVREDSPTDELRLKMDDHRWRIAVHQADTDGFGYAGFELANASAFDTAVEELREAGVPVRPGDEGELKSRSVGGLAVLEDPAGNRVELYHRPALDYRFVSPHDARFVTDGVGFGHAVFFVDGEHYEACREFYIERLGFRVSEYTTLGPIELCFLHCNKRHHSIALGRASATSCQHIMLQVEELDMVGCALDRAKGTGVPIVATLGRHRNDRMFSFYMRTPNGIDLEYGWGAREVDDDTWVVSDWEGGDVWGHHGVETLENL